MAYEIKLDIFEGPLDLLLYLIRKNEIDIYNIPIALITEQYLGYIDAMKSLNLDLAGEYLVLASTLIHIKSRMLLPSREEDGEEEEDPRDELVKQLIEYKTFKEAALRLNNLTLLDRDVFIRAATEEIYNEPFQEELTLEEIGIFELVAAFRRAIASAGYEEALEIDVERISLSERINEIVDILQERKRTTFSELIGDRTDRVRIIYTFLAILELMKLQVLRAYQTEPYGEIRLSAAE